jgi:hypothetical protein
MGSGESSLSLLLAVGWPSREYERDRGCHTVTRVSHENGCASVEFLFE